MAAAQRELLSRALWSSPVLAPVLQAWHRIALPNAWLVSGAVAQTVWNQAHDFSASHGVSDIDLVYFDDVDLSAESEAAHERRINRLFAELGVPFDVKNQARVHLWYEARFGSPIAAYTSAEAAIATFPTTAGAVGVRPGGDGLEICAPFGLDDLMGLVVRPNKTQITPEIYRAKVARWRPFWPKLKVVEW